MRGTYDRNKINALLDQVCAEIGAGQFSALRLLELEKVVRLRDKQHALPGKTVLRAAINNYRSARWPETLPKRLDRRF